MISDIFDEVTERNYSLETEMKLVKARLACLENALHSLNPLVTLVKTLSEPLKTNCSTNELEACSTLLKSLTGEISKQLQARREVIVYNVPDKYPYNKLITAFNEAKAPTPLNNRRLKKKNLQQSCPILLTFTNEESARRFINQEIHIRKASKLLGLCAKPSFSPLERHTHKLAGIKRSENTTSLNLLTSATSSEPPTELSHLPSTNNQKPHNNPLVQTVHATTTALQSHANTECKNTDAIFISTPTYALIAYNVPATYNLSKLIQLLMHHYPETGCIKSCRRLPLKNNATPPIQIELSTETDAAYLLTNKRPTTLPDDLLNITLEPSQQKPAVPQPNSSQPPQPNKTTKINTTRTNYRPTRSLLGPGPAKYVSSGPKLQPITSTPTNVSSNRSLHHT